MAQGARGWVRVAATGLGVLVCSALVGCMNTDKDKKDKIATKQPTPGLPGLPTLPANNTAGNTKMGGPTQFGSGGIQPTAGTMNQPRYGTGGMNDLRTGAPQPNYGGPGYGAGVPSTIGAPGQPSFVPSVQPNTPAGGGFAPAGGTPPPSWGGNNTAAPVAPGAPPATVASASPLYPGGSEPLAPPPPGSLPGTGVVPPVSAVAPLPPVSLPPGATASAAPFGK